MNSNPEHGIKQLIALARVLAWFFTLLSPHLFAQSLAAQTPPHIAFEKSSYVVQEDAGTAFLQVRLTNCGARRPAGTVQLRIIATDSSAIEGKDYFVFAQGTIGSVAPEKNGSNPRVFRSLEVPLQIIHDELNEPTENFLLQISIEEPATLDCGDGATRVSVGNSVSVSIENVPFDVSTVRFSRSEVFVTEGDDGDIRVAHFVIERLSGSKPVSALCQTTRGGSATEHQDFTPIAVVLGWGEDDLTTRTCDVVIVSDDATERLETVQMVLEPLKGSIVVASSNATIRIADDDSPGRVQFTSTHFEVREGGLPANITVIRKGGTEGVASVVLTVRARSAKPGKDYVLGDTRLTWADGQGGPVTVEIEIVDDLQPEPPETLVLGLEATSVNTLGDLRSAVLEIHDDDPEQ